MKQLKNNDKGKLIVSGYNPLVDYKSHIVLYYLLWSIVFLIFLLGVIYSAYDPQNFLLHLFSGFTVSILLWLLILIYYRFIIIRMWSSQHPKIYEKGVVPPFRPIKILNFPKFPPLILSLKSQGEYFIPWKNVVKIECKEGFDPLIPSKEPQKYSKPFKIFTIVLKNGARIDIPSYYFKDKQKLFIKEMDKIRGEYIETNISNTQ